MHSNLSFLAMPAAPTPKVLKAFRKDAGWNETGDAALNGAFAPGSRVQWAAVLRLSTMCFAIACRIGDIGSRRPPSPAAAGASSGT